MVLQRSDRTVIYGTATPGKSIWLRFRTPAGKNVAETWKSEKAGPSGGWQLTLDLNSSKIPSVCCLWLTEEGRSRSALELTNVALGDVWLLDGWEGQGLPAQAGEISDDLDRRQIRFWHLGQAAAELNSGAALAGWIGWPDAAAYPRYSTLTLRLAHLLAAGKFSPSAQPGYVGICLVTPEAMKQGLVSAEQPARLPHNPEDWDWATRRVKDAEAVWLKQLIAFKRQGIVTNLPSVVRYDEPRVLPYAAFSQDRSPAGAFIFKGAIAARRSLTSK